VGSGPPCRGRKGRLGRRDQARPGACPRPPRDPFRPRRSRRPSRLGAARPWRAARRRLVRHLRGARPRGRGVGAARRSLTPLGRRRGGCGLAGAARRHRLGRGEPASRSSHSSPARPGRAHQTGGEQPILADLAARLAAAGRRYGRRRGRRHVRGEVRLRHRRASRGPARPWCDRRTAAPRRRQGHLAGRRSGRH